MKIYLIYLYKIKLSLICLLLLDSTDAYSQKGYFAHVKYIIPVIKLAPIDSVIKIKYWRGGVPPVYLNGMLVPCLLYSVKLNKYLSQIEVINMIPLSHIKRVNRIASEDESIRLHVPLGALFIRAHAQELTKILKKSKSAQWVSPCN